jgi:hypothetical protein
MIGDFMGLEWRGGELFNVVSIDDPVADLTVSEIPGDSHRSLP